MKLSYLANVRLPSEKAHANQIMQMCAALAAAGAEVELIHPRRANYAEFERVDDVWAYYGVPHNFERRAVGSIELFDLMDRLGWRGRGFRFAFAAQLGGYTASLIPVLRRRRADVFYSREITTVALLRFIHPRDHGRVFFEAHTFPGSRAGVALHRFALRGIGGVVAITRGLADEYADLGVPPDRLCVAPDAVDLTRFGKGSRLEARRKLGWPEDAPIVVYTGHFYSWKGVDTLIEAMRDPALASARLYLVGGTPEMIAEMRAKLFAVPNVTVVGWVAPTEVPTCLAAADVLVLPNSGREAISRRHTSPLKLFEYMAAERPIVASDLPSLREVLTDGEHAILVRPDDAAELARGIRRALDNPALAAQLTRQAREDAASFTWEKRAWAALDFVEKNWRASQAPTGLGRR